MGPNRFGFAGNDGALASASCCYPAFWSFRGDDAIEQPEVRGEENLCLSRGRLALNSEHVQRAAEILNRVGRE